MNIKTGVNKERGGREKTNTNDLHKNNTIKISQAFLVQILM